MKRNFLMIECDQELKERLKKLAARVQAKRKRWYSRPVTMTSTARMLLINGLTKYEKKNAHLSDL